MIVQKSSRTGTAPHASIVSGHIVIFEILGNEIPILDVETLIELKDTIRDKDKMDLAFLKEKLKKRRT